MNNQLIPTVPPDMSKTVQNLARELNKIGFKVVVCNNFVDCFYTKDKTKIGMSVAGLEVRFNNRLTIVAPRQNGFYLAFEPF